MIDQGMESLDAQFNETRLSQLTSSMFNEPAILNHHSPSIGNRGGPVKSVDKRKSCSRALLERPDASMKRVRLPERCPTSCMLRA